MLRKQGSTTWFEETNAERDNARDSVLKALKDGRLHMTFTVLRCVGYPEDWFEKLLHYEKHPKPT
ncbi:hypothetical protein B0H19DRAFT_165767 [Mycena capillaripes]|nr:hypothetical protein B0H19DRAFT_165767 [Mycena capillaripes]